MSNAAQKIEKQEVIERAAPLAPAQPSEATALIAMIDRAARDDTVNIEKMRELLAMRKEIKAQEAEEAFRDAMSAVQGEMQPIVADSNNPQTQSKYASYAALDRALRPIYSKHGFALSFNTEQGAPDGHVRVVCWVSCKGHKEKYQIDMPADGKGAKGGDVMTKTHAPGSGATYGQRYLLKMIFNIAVSTDDDGNAASRQPKEQITEEQADKMRDTIRVLVTDTKMPIEKFLTWAKAESISDIPTADLKDVIASLEERKRKLGAKS